METAIMETAIMGLDRVLVLRVERISGFRGRRFVWRFRV